MNHMTSGASNDIERATDIAQHMVCEWGMSELGPLAYRKPGNAFEADRAARRQRSHRAARGRGDPPRRHGRLRPRPRRDRSSIARRCACWPKQLLRSGVARGRTRSARCCTGGRSGRGSGAPPDRHTVPSDLNDRRHQPDDRTTERSAPVTIIPELDGVPRTRIASGSNGCPAFARGVIAVVVSRVLYTLLAVLAGSALPVARRRWRAPRRRSCGAVLPLKARPPDVRGASAHRSPSSTSRPVARRQSARIGAGHRTVQHVQARRLGRWSMAATSRRPCARDADAGRARRWRAPYRIGVQRAGVWTVRRRGGRSGRRSRAPAMPGTSRRRVGQASSRDDRCRWSSSPARRCCCW